MQLVSQCCYPCDDLAQHMVCMERHHMIRLGVSGHHNVPVKKMTEVVILLD